MGTKTKEALRIIGHLLETNGTVGHYARDDNGDCVDYFHEEACKFCLAGASYVVDEKVYGKGEYSEALAREVKSYLKVSNIIQAWDDTTPAGRKKIIQKLKNA